MGGVENRTQTLTARGLAPRPPRCWRVSYTPCPRAGTMGLSALDRSPLLPRWPVGSPAGGLLRPLRSGRIGSWVALPAPGLPRPVLLHSWASLSSAGGSPPCTCPVLAPSLRSGMFCGRLWGVVMPAWNRPGTCITAGGGTPGRRIGPRWACGPGVRQRQGGGRLGPRERACGGGNTRPAIRGIVTWPFQTIPQLPDCPREERKGSGGKKEKNFVVRSFLGFPCTFESQKRRTGRCFSLSQCSKHNHDLCKQSFLPNTPEVTSRGSVFPSKFLLILGAPGGSVG